MNELIERLARVSSEAASKAETWDSLEIEKACVRAVLAELAKADVGEVMPTVDELQKAYTGAAIATCESRHTTGARITDIPKAGYMAIANLVAGRINPIIAALRARVAELEAHIASRMPYPDIHIAASPEAIDEVLADEPIADPAERAKKVAEILRDERGLRARPTVSGLGVFIEEMRYHETSTYATMGARAIADNIQAAEARSAKEWAAK